MACKMFADDTTLYLPDKDLSILISRFLIKIKPLIEWCIFNRLDINWSKTYFMVITNQRIKKKLPKFILIDNHQVQFVEMFKLLGIPLDNNLSFSTHCSELKKIISKKLFSIRRLF